MRLSSAIAITMSIVATSAVALETSPSPGGASLASLTQSAPGRSRPLPIAAEDARLIGEAASREFPIYLTARRGSAPGEVHLGLPERDLGNAGDLQADRQDQRRRRRGNGCPEPKSGGGPEP